jgi:hypothetical protein
MFLSEGFDSIDGSGSRSFVSYFKIPINHEIIELTETLENTFYIGK